MPQTLGRFDTPIRGHDGNRYLATICGREDDTGRWEGWIEFEAIETGEVLRTGRETTQPNITDLRYWATGLTEVYLEGALERTLRPPAPRAIRPMTAPAYDGPANSGDAVLNPFFAYEKNPEVLAQQLRALGGWRLRQIIREYGLAREQDDLDLLTEPELRALILRGVRSSRA